MIIRAIDHVNIRAPAAEVAKLRQFYRDVMGLADGWRPPFASRGFWLYAGGHPLVHLVEGDPAPSAADGAGIAHVAFLCADLEACEDRLRNNGLEFRVTQVPTVGQRQLLLRDPLGTGIEITAAAPAE